MSTEVSISVIVPVRNGAQFLSYAMDSITSQQWGNLEVLLIDDGSSDDLSTRLRACPQFVHYIRQEPQGPAAARNRGIRQSAGDLIAFLDIDDLWTNTHLQTLSDTLELNPEAAIAQGLMRQFWMEPDGRYFRTSPYRMPYLGSCLFRRGVFGEFDERMPYGEDYDFLFRCWENDILKVNVEKLSLLYRRHPGNMTRGRNHAAHIQVWKRRMERIKAGLTDPTQPRRFAFQDYIGDRESVSELSSMEVSEWNLRSA
jgi:glycosyltransferase involved in cell wall biosynthesis